MAFVYSLSPELKEDPVKVDIICVPAIGADPRTTWARQPHSSGHEHDRLDQVLHSRLYPDAEIHLYDHLTPDERSLELKPSQGPNDQAHEKAAAAETNVAQYGIAEWADRFLESLQGQRQAQEFDRPVIFICHSTGGLVVKQALSRKVTNESTDIMTTCLGVTFFASPHHGSSVLSDPEFVETVRENLGLKWEMSENLRHDVSLGNPDLEILNYKFAVRAVGMKIYSYVESSDTDFAVLSTDNIGGETLTNIRQHVVDNRSGQLQTSTIPIENEEVIPLKTTHVGAPRFLGEETLFSDYINELTAFVKGISSEEHAAYHDLHDAIMTGTEIDVHQFYEVSTKSKSKAIKILSARPCLRTFLELGPKKCMEERLQGLDGIEGPQSEGSIRPTFEFRPASEPAAPTLTVTRVDSDKLPSENGKIESNPKLAVPPPKYIHTKRPSTTEDTTLSNSQGLLEPKHAKSVKFRDTFFKDESEKFELRGSGKMQKKRLFPLPNLSSERFKWIHVPFTHAGWVPHILTTISQEKEDFGLHSQVLTDKMWISQHNRSRHASPHARFVRPGVKCLLPSIAESGPLDGISTPCSATEDIQFITYIPYLHWDSFTNLQRRAALIKRRLEQTHPRPIAKDVTLGRSLEHKLIWQYLLSDRPVHCRRTLDQYGYPSLRNTAVRDGDQILYKRTKAEVDPSPPKEPPRPTFKPKHRSSPGRRSVAAGAGMDGSEGAGSADDAAKVLMVDQMWLWIIDSKTVITFFSPKEKKDNDSGSKEGDLRDQIYQDINGDYANQCVDPYDFAALAVFHAIKALLEGTSDRNLQVFRIFEEYISILTEQQTASFKTFRNSHRFETAKDLNAQSYIDNRKDLDALLELRDIEDELKTIDKLIREQQTCVKEMIAQYRRLNSPSHGKGRKGITSLENASQFLNEHKEQVTSMLDGATAAQRAFKDLLDMKQKQANIVEAHLAREQAEVAADQSRSVMIFTIFTIIFLPLSFFASVFGINSREWTGGNYPRLHTIFTYMGSISLAVIIIALLVAFNKFTRRMSQRFWKIVAMPCLVALHRLGILRRMPTHLPSAAAGVDLDVEKAAAIKREQAEGERLSTISRTHTAKLNWEDELKMHRSSVFGF